MNVVVSKLRQWHCFWTWPFGHPYYSRYKLRCPECGRWGL